MVFAGRECINRVFTAKRSRSPMHWVCRNGESPGEGGGKCPWDAGVAMKGNPIELKWN